MNYISLQKKDEIILLTINSPKTFNALNSVILKELEQSIDDLYNDDKVKVLMITGAGKSFVAGADIKEMSNFSKEEGENFSNLGNRIFQKIANLPIPTVALVNGFALGGGCELALSCDFRLASEKAKMGFPEVGLGIIPGFGGTQRLSKTIGISKAKQLIFTAEIINAQKALSMGLVNEVFLVEELLDKGYEIARKIAGNSNYSVKKAKSAIDEGMETNIKEGLNIEAENFGDCFAHPDQKEGMSAFLEKRTSVFK